MLFLLRKIRRKLMQDNKVMTYLLYAIGEIFLVVIGILIAVSIDDLNEQRKLDARAEKLLIQIQDEALSTIKLLENRLNGFHFDDSLYRIVLADTITYETYIQRESAPLRTFAFQWGVNSLSIKNNVFDAFVSKVDEFSPKYQELAKPISDAYFDYESSAEIIEKKLMDGLDEHQKVAKSQPWWPIVYSDEPEKMHPDFIKYLMEDFRYKNAARSHLINLSNLNVFTLKLQKNLVDIYKLIDATLESPRVSPPFIENYYVQLTPKEQQKLYGNYISIQDATYSFKLFQEGNEVYLNSLKHNQKFKVNIICNNRIIIAPEGTPTAASFSYDTEKGMIYSRNIGGPLISYKKQ